jgi:signal transduction histidine kinase
VREAAFNAARHSRARTFSIRIHYDERELRMRAEDDGVGMTEAAQAASGGHFGLVGMRERARLIGGRLRLESAPDRGTAIEVVVPLREPL